MQEYNHTGVDALTNNTLCPDSITGVVTDDNGCVQELAVPILTSPSDIVINGITSDLDCNNDGDGSIDITATGGNGILTPAWTTVVPGSGIIAVNIDQSGLSGGTYKIVITDDNLCQDSATFVINEPNAIFSDGTVNNIFVLVKKMAALPSIFLVALVHLTLLGPLQTLLL